MRRLLAAWLILAVSIAIAVAVVPGVDVDGGITSYLWIAVIFGLINTVLGPLLRLLTLPLILLTLGLFALVVNTILLALTAWLSDSLSIDGFVAAFVAALIISIVDSVINFIWRPRRENAEGRR